MKDSGGFGSSLANELRNSNAAQVTLNRCVSPESITHSEHERALELLRVGAAFHADFLASAVEVESVEAIRRYTSWACNALESRNMTCGTVAEYFATLAEEYRRVLREDDWAALSKFFDSAMGVCAAKLTEPSAFTSM
jgi:hypothetical protein